MSTRVPRVSVAIPLYRSAPFVENVAANIERLGDLDAEILVSDRHGADDAADQIEARFKGDRRVRVLRRRDAASWVTHYNDLLREARGTFFCWMPHDDHYDAGYVPGLAAALEGEPRAVLAFGVMRATGATGVSVPVGPFVAPPLDAVDAWSTLSAIRLLLGWELFRAFRGLVRREVVIERGLFLPAMHETVRADVCWAFSVALAGPLLFVPGVACTKHYQRSSASAGWRYGVRAAVSEWRVLNQSLWRYASTRTDALGGIAVMTGVTALRIGWRSARSIGGRG